MGGVSKSFFKIHLGSQTLKQCKLYNLDPFGFHKNQFLYKSLFIVFFSFLLERQKREREREESPKFDNEREGRRSSHFRPLKQVFLVFTDFMRWEELDGGYLKLQCCLKKQI